MEVISQSRKPVNDKHLLLQNAFESNGLKISKIKTDDELVQSENYLVP